MGKRKEITCACGCGLKRMVEISDIKRKWGKYINHSHAAKAMHQEGRGKPGHQRKKVIKKSNKDLFNNLMGLM